MSALYIQKEGRQLGPFTTEELEGQVASGAFTQEDLYWTDGMEDWHPLSEIVETSAEEAHVAVAPEVPPETEMSEPEEKVYFNEEGIFVSISEISWKDTTLEPPLVAKCSATIEKVRRVGPLLGAVIFGVASVVIALLEIPKTTTTHWVLWSGVLAVLLLATVRMLYAGLRAARSMVVIDMVDGSEYIIPTGPGIARRVSECITEASEEARQQVAIR